MSQKHRITAKKSVASEYETLLDEVTYKIIRKLAGEAGEEEVKMLRAGIDKVISDVLFTKQ